MKRKTEIGHELTIAERKEKYDASCKRLLANKSILAWILKECAGEFAECDICDIRDRYINGEPEISQEAVHRDEVTGIAGLIREYMQKTGCSAEETMNTFLIPEEQRNEYRVLPGEEE